MAAALRSGKGRSSSTVHRGDAALRERPLNPRDMPSTPHVMLAGTSNAAEPALTQAAPRNYGAGVSRPGRADAHRRRSVEWDADGLQQRSLDAAFEAYEDPARRLAACRILRETRSFDDELPLSPVRAHPCTETECNCNISHSQLTLSLALADTRVSVSRLYERGEARRRMVAARAEDRAETKRRRFDKENAPPPPTPQARERPRSAPSSASSVGSAASPAGQSCSDCSPAARTADELGAANIMLAMFGYGMHIDFD